MMTNLTKQVKEKVKAVAATALAPGELDGGRRAKPAIWDNDTAALKVSIKCSLLKMKDGTWAWVGAQRALVEKDTGPVLVMQTVGPGKEQSGDWLKRHVESALMGVLCIGGAAGGNAKLSYQGMPVSVMPVTEGESFKELSVVVNGASTVKPIGEALAMLGLTDRMEPWSGGDVPLALRQSPPLPSGEEIAAARVPAQAFVGGGAWGLTRAARLAGMGWTIDPTADVAVEEGAVMLAALAGDERLAPALAAALAVRQAGEDAVAEEDASSAPSARVSGPSALAFRPFRPLLFF